MILLVVEYMPLSQEILHYAVPLDLDVWHAAPLGGKGVACYNAPRSMQEDNVTHGVPS